MYRETFRRERDEIKFSVSGAQKALCRVNLTPRRKKRQGQENKFFAYFHIYN